MLKSRSNKNRSSQTKRNKYLSKAQIAVIITTLTAILALYGKKDQTNIVYTTALYMIERIKKDKYHILLGVSGLGPKLIEFVQTYNPWTTLKVHPNNVKAAHEIVEAYLKALRK